jgi:hypothetical protein
MRRFVVSKSRQRSRTRHARRPPLTSVSAGTVQRRDDGRTTTVTVTPKWKSRLLTIEATSTNPKAILSVFSQSGGFMFELTDKGDGKYSDQRGFIFSPEVITVRSNLGGSATARVTS